MEWNSHFRLEGKHAFLSASKYAWIRYSDEKLEEAFSKAMYAQKGTRLHNLAAEAISLGIKLPRSSKTLNMYVNDAIGFKMQPEQILYYSENAFGTADAISFRKGQLRIHDLKTGVSPTSMDQLLVYTALFCLEYNFKPGQIETELRIYQNDEVQVYSPEVEEIIHVMDTMTRFNQKIELMKAEALA